MLILIVKLSALGDIIQTLPALYSLKKAYPKAQIDWVTEEIGNKLLCDHPLVNQIIIYQRHNWPKNIKRAQWKQVIKEFMTFKRDLNKRYDMVIDFQGLLKSAFVTFLTNGKERIGFANSHEGSHLVLTKKFRANYDEPAVIRYLKLVQFAGIPVDFNDIRFPLPKAVEPDLEIKPPYIVINPIARWESKMWFKEKWTDLGKELASLGYKVVFSGKENNRSYINHICQSFNKGINLAGKTSLKSLISLYKKARLVISLDTGTMHLAAATGTPVIALFGPTAPWRTGPWGKEHQVIYKNLHCQPCFKKDCPTRECLQRIEVKEVISTLRRYL